jgi:hypothetical protein
MVLPGVAGCSQDTSLRGTVLGTFIEVSGPALITGGRFVPGKPIALPGRVVARGQSGQIFSVHVGENGHFRMLLPPGTYRFTGYGPFGRDNRGCSVDNAITVRAGLQVAHVEVVCAGL